MELKRRERVEVPVWVGAIVTLARRSALRGRREGGPTQRTDRRSLTRDQDHSGGGVIAITEPDLQVPGVTRADLFGASDCGRGERDEPADLPQEAG